MDENCARCPRTAAILDALPLVRIREHAPEICFSVLTPGTHILPHRGVTNTRVVTHFPLVVPEDCALNVGGELRAWEAGHCFTFDDTFEHEAWNRGESNRVVMLMDCWNPYLTQIERDAVTELRRCHWRLQSRVRYCRRLTASAGFAPNSPDANFNCTIIVQVVVLNFCQTYPTNCKITLFQEIFELAIDVAVVRHPPNRKYPMSAANVSKLTGEDNKIEFVDLRFADMLGVQHHVTFPAHSVDDTFFEDGKMFDGSSITGWKGINDSDMVLMPDASSAVIDPFTADPTLILTCDVLEPSTMQAYSRCPRSIARRAEAFLKSTGIADTAFFGPEPEFFIFDSVRWRNEMRGASFEIESEEAAWSSGRRFDEGNSGHRPGIKGGYFPVSPVDSLGDIRGEICKVLGQFGQTVEVHHHEVATVGQCEIGIQVQYPGEKG